MSRYCRFLPLLAAAFLTMAGAAPTAAQGCLSPGEARAAVQEGAAKPLSQLRGQIAASAGGEVVSAELCRAGGRLVYVVNVLSGGQVKRLTVDAQNGNILR